MELIIHLLRKLCSPCRVLGVLESQMGWLPVTELLQAGSVSGQRRRWAEARDAGAAARDAGAEPGVCVTQRCVPSTATGERSAAGSRLLPVVQILAAPQEKHGALHV